MAFVSQTERMCSAWNYGLEPSRHKKLEEESPPSCSACHHKIQPGQGGQMLETYSFMSLETRRPWSSDSSMMSSFHMAIIIMKIWLWNVKFWNQAIDNIESLEDAQRRRCSIDLPYLFKSKIGKTDCVGERLLDFKRQAEWWLSQYEVDHSKRTSNLATLLISSCCDKTQKQCRKESDYLGLESQRESPYESR